MGHQTGHQFSQQTEQELAQQLSQQPGQSGQPLTADENGKSSASGLPIRILIIEDDPQVRESMQKISEEMGLAPIIATSAAEGLKLAKSRSPDLILLDLMLPDGHGFEVCRHLQQHPDAQNIPIIFVSASTDLDSRVEGLNLGGSDYICKPFHKKELIARIHACLRQLNRAQSRRKLLEFGDLRVDLSSKQVSIEGTAISLTKTEYELIETLALTPNQVVDKKVLLERLWPNTHVNHKTLDTHLSNLRKKMSSCADKIRTVHGIGYMLHDS